jgi:hypothetical protein
MTLTQLSWVSHPTQGGARAKGKGGKGGKREIRPPSETEQNYASFIETRSQSLFINPPSAEMVFLLSAQSQRKAISQSPSRFQIWFPYQSEQSSIHQKQHPERRFAIEALVLLSVP